MNSTQKWLIAAVLVLIAINIALMVVVWRGHSRMAVSPPIHDQMRRPEITGRSLIRDLAMDRQQRDQFRTIFEEHRRTMDSLSVQMRQIKHDINQSIVLGDTTDLATRNSKLFAIQQEIELETQQLTKKLAEIATPEQRAKFLKSMQGALIHNRPARMGRQGQ